MFLIFSSSMITLNVIHLYRYYPMNLEVKDDKELQNFANEVSEEGSGPNGGKGHVSHSKC